ncbi:hypothetical protein SAMN05880574_10325 [Chryseobacterium sp. RU37D]|nr:hypothetical protein SAMN05880574_10325 [Chryseobacterium sp. RU37D]
MTHSVISFIKSEVYKNTQYHISKHEFDKSKTICFFEKDLVKAEWREEKEFTLNGFSYDVINTNFIDGTKYFYCYQDKKDIIINSILKFSGLFVNKKVYAWRHFDLPIHGKKIIKTSNSFIFLINKEIQFLNLFLLKLTSEYLKRLENPFCQSIIIPPPESFFQLL